MSKEGQGFFTEKGVVASMAKLAAELDMFLTVERSAQTSMPDPPNIALPMLLERKGLALEAKSTAVHAFADSPDQLREYRSLLAYRSTLARGTRSTSIEREVPPKTADEVDRQIQTIEVEAQRRSTQAVAAAQSKAVSTHPQQKQYSEALAKASMKRYSEATKRARKTDPGDLAALMMEAQQKAMADVAPRFKDYLDAQQQGLQQTDRGGRESLLRSIQAKLPETAALLEMVRFRPFNPRALAEADRWEPARYGAYLVKQTGTPVFLDYGEAGPVDELVVEFRRTLASPRGTLAHDLGRRLDAMLMQPTRAQLGTTTHLYVSPDGALNLVPFGALVDEQDRYLIETFTFNYLSSGRDLTREARRGTAQLGPAVVIADPAFDGEVKPGATPASTDSAASTSSRGSLNHFDSLPGTAVEAQAIKRILSDATVYTGGRATETMLKSVKVPRVLHVATHGFFLDDQDLSAASSSPGASQPAEDPMLRSGLVFAGANSRQSGTDDGVLTALEAAGLDLAGTQLVVLSACETGVGAVRAGEGVFGLRRAFTVAGAETLVMSLWQVDDDATQRLMVEFYGRLAKGEGRGEALRQASLTLLRDPAHRHPFYWSSFISTGESGPMRR
jgi:CHAT domain-containing protein